MGPKYSSPAINLLLDEVAAVRGGLSATDEIAWRNEKAACEVERVIIESPLPPRKTIREIASWCAGVESPIEAVFATRSWLVLSMKLGGFAERVEKKEAEYLAHGLQAYVNVERIAPQRPCPCDTTCFYVDFFLEVSVCAVPAEDGLRDHATGIFRTSGLIVECDGRDGHDGWEQRERDEMRTCLLVAGGYGPVVRFSGAQINGDPRGCVLIAADALLAQLPDPKAMLALVGEREEQRRRLVIDNPVGARSRELAIV